jgi:hypothetical protein
MLNLKVFLADDALKLSVELEAFNKAEESNRTSRGYLRSADSNNRDDENKLNLSANSIDTCQLRQLLKHLVLFACFSFE